MPQPLLFVLRKEYYSIRDDVLNVLKLSLCSNVLHVHAIADADELKNSLRYAKSERLKAILLFFVGPEVLSEMKRLYNDVLSLDELVMHIAGTYTNERIVVLTTSREDERVLLDYKSIYEVTPRQLDVMRIETGDLRSIANDFNRLITLGYTKALLSSPDLLLLRSEIEEAFLEVIGVKRGFEILSILDFMKEALSSFDEGAKPSGFEIKRVLPCIADSTKIRVVAQYNAQLSRVLPYLYLHFKNSRYLDSLGVLTFLTDRNEMVTLYSSGKACIVKVESEDRAKEILKGLLDLMIRAHDISVKQGAPSSEVFEARKRLNVMSIYRLLPKTNCGACGERTCMAFAASLMSGKARLSDCKPLIEDPRFKDSYAKLKAIISSPLEQ